MHSKTVPLAKAGLLGALCVAFLYFGALLPGGRLSFLAISSLCMMSAMIETSTKRAIILFVAVSAVAFFILPQKAILGAFFLFFGPYPILKKKLERCTSRGLAYALKLLFFNVDAGLSCFLVFRFFAPGMPAFFSLWMLPVFIFAANVVFLLFDHVLTLAFDLYLRKIYTFR